MCKKEMKLDTPLAKAKAPPGIQEYLDRGDFYQSKLFARRIKDAHERGKWLDEYRERKEKGADTLIYH